MKPLEKAVWYIETHFGEDITLANVAKAAGLSKFHLVRAFRAYAGQSVMGYVRARRLSEAAKRLVNDRGGILDVALAAGYNSHAAFTRAFRAQFGITPDQLRQRRTLAKINLVEPLTMDQTTTNLPEPRLIDSGALLIVGLKNRYSEATTAQIPAQWQAFQPHIGNIDNQTGHVAFGVLCNSDDKGNVDYLTGVEVRHFPADLNGLDSLRLSAQTYAVFRHDGHVSEIRPTWKTIFAQWLPDAPYRLVDAPQLERYGAGFDPQTGVGDIEVWIPVAR